MFDMEKHLAEKAKESGVELLKPVDPVNLDATIFLIGNDKGWAAISVSGLEEVQNSSEEKMKDLLDTRFTNALRVLGRTR